jgi:hypothetical protein
VRYDEEAIVDDFSFVMAFHEDEELLVDRRRNEPTEEGIKARAVAVTARR